MKGAKLPEGWIGIMNQQTGYPEPRSFHEPDENQELFIIKDGEPVLYRKKTTAERIQKATALMNDGIASFEAAIDELGEIDE